MSDLNTSPEQKDQLDLVYGLNDRPKPFVAFLAAFQHLLAIIVPIVTPGLLICLALGVSKEDTNMILSMSLVISGIATFLQCKRVGPFGAGLLIVQGTSFNFIGPIIGIGSAMVAAGTSVESVMAAIFGVVIAGSFIEMGVSQILPWIKRLITPLVTGIVVLLIGLTLIKVGLTSMGGGYGAMKDGTFANADNLIMSCTVLGLIILLNRLKITWIKSSAILIALIVGYALAGFMGHLDFSGLKDAANHNEIKFFIVQCQLADDSIYIQCQFTGRCIDDVKRYPIAFLRNPKNFLSKERREMEIPSSYALDQFKFVGSLCE